MPTIRVASLNPTTESRWQDGELRHNYAYEDATLDEAVALACRFVDRGMGMAREAAAAGAKLALLPEGLPNLGRWRRSATLATGDLREAWMRCWDYMVTAMTRTAAELGLHLAAGGVERSGGRYYNSTAIVDDRGGFVGSYHKVHLTDGEARVLERGDGFPVFPTRLGVLGVYTCWDTIFPESTQTLMLNGAELLLHPTYGHAGPQCDFTAQARAHDSVTPIVIAMWCGNGRIIEKDGTIIAAGSMAREDDNLIPDRMLVADLAIGAARKLGEFNDARAGILRQRRPALYQPPCGQVADSPVRPAGT